MGKGAYVSIRNLSSKALTVSYSDLNCMFESGDEGSNFGPISGALGVGRSLPSSGNQYIEAKGSGLCAFKDSTFKMNIQGADGTLSVNFSENSSTWRTDSPQVMAAGLRADVSVQAGDQYQLNVTVSDPWAAASWMADTAAAIANRPLNEVVLPGTHDSGTFAISRFSALAPQQDIPQWINAVYALGLGGAAVMGIIAGWSKTQPYNITQQLEAGIRYLDLRVVRNGGDYFLCHGMYSINVDELISSVAEFIKKYPKEIIILDFNHLYAMSGLDDSRPLIEKMIQAFGSKMAPNTMSPTSTINDFWGKGYQIIALYDDGASVNTYSQLWCQSQISSRWPNTTDLATLQSRLDDYVANRFANELFVLQGVLTPDAGMIAKGLVPFTSDPGSIQALAGVVTPQVMKWVQAWSKRKLNIVIVDWFNVVDYVATIRQINVEKARA